MGTLKEGNMFKEMGFISQSVRTANMSTLGDVMVGVIDKKTFKGVLNNLPEDLRPIILSLVERLKITTPLLTPIGVELETTRNKFNS